MEDVEIFPISIIDDLVDDSLSQNIPTCYDEININEIKKNQWYRDSLATTENITSKSCVTRYLTSTDYDRDLEEEIVQLIVRNMHHSMNHNWNGSTVEGGSWLGPDLSLRTKVKNEC